MVSENTEDVDQPHGVEDPVAAAFATIEPTHPGATRLLVEPYQEDGATAMRLLAVRSGAGELLWFDQDNYGHPDAVAACGSPDLDLAGEVVSAVQELVLRASQRPNTAAFSPAGPDAYQGLRRQPNLLTVAAPTS